MPTESCATSPPKHGDHHGDQQIDRAAQAERAAHLGRRARGAGGAGVHAAARRMMMRDLDQRHDAGAHHHAVRHIRLGDVAAGDDRGEQRIVEQQRRIAAHQQADAEHRQRPDVADERDAERRHDGGRDQPVAGDADDDADAQDRRLPAAFVAGADRLGCRGAGRPGAGGGEHLGIEHAVQQIAVEQHRQEHAGEQRRHEVGTAEHERECRSAASARCRRRRSQPRSRSAPGSARGSSDSARTRQAGCGPAPCRPAHRSARCWR